VRLVEQVSDHLDPAEGTVVLAPADLHLVRSVFGKWSTEILLALHATPSAGFEDLRRSLQDISARVLSIKLRDLEENHMIRREIIDSRPPRVRYSLTDRGWTVAWLARPIFLYLRTATVEGVPRASPGAAIARPGAPKRRALEPPALLPRSPPSVRARGRST
jgi:DNA-binding HxlR family transcriptional regulator